MLGWFSAPVAVSLVGLLLGGSGVAMAQGKGVHVDPDSPAGKEYALPLDSARREAGGGSGAPSAGGGGGSAPLFGAGISERGDSSVEGGSASGGGGSASGDGQSKRSRGGGEDDGGAAPRDAGATQRARVVADTRGGLSAGVLTLLIALGVLAVGGLIGLSARAFRRTHPTG